jgi:hypothetical protein
MSARSASEYTMFASAQRPSNDDDLDSSVMGRLGESVARGGAPYDSVFVPQDVVVVGLRFKWYNM